MSTSRGDRYCWLRVGSVVTVFLLAAGCTALKPRLAPTSPPRTTAPTPVATPEPVPPAPVTIKTVPPRTPTVAGATAIPTRPLKNPEAEKAKRAGKAIGPVVTFAGVARADGRSVEPQSVDPHGVPTFVNYVGSGFMIVVEAEPGISNLEVGRRVFAYDPEDPLLRPDLEIEADHDLGDGSLEICDQRRPNIGGIPGINPPSFAETAQIAATLNDFSCRFEQFGESDASCTVNEYGDFSFLRPDESTIQFCMVVARVWSFPEGDTIVSVRLRDTEGNPGPVSTFLLRRTKRPTPPPRPKQSPTPTVSRRRP